MEVFFSYLVWNHPVGHGNPSDGSRITVMQRVLTNLFSDTYEEILSGVAVETTDRSVTRGMKLPRAGWNTPKCFTSHHLHEIHRHSVSPGLLAPALQNVLRGRVRLGVVSI